MVPEHARQPYGFTRVQQDSRRKLLPVACMWPPYMLGTTSMMVPGWYPSKQDSHRRAIHRTAVGSLCYPCRRAWPPLAYMLGTTSMMVTVLSPTVMVCLAPG